MKTNLPVFFALLVAVLMTMGSAVAQNTPDTPTALDPAELERQYGRLRTQSFYRHPSTFYDAVMRYSRMDPDTMNPGDAFVLAYYEGRWDDVQQTLAMLPDDLADRIYDKMLADLTGQNVPVVTLGDFIGLSDICPSTLHRNRLRQLGLVLRVAVAKEQEVWLRRALEKGTRFLGNEGERRLTTGQILMHADFDELAVKYLPSLIEATQLADASARSEIVRYLEAQEELEDFQQTQIGDLWRQQADVLSDPQADDNKKRYAAERLAELVVKAPTPAIEPWIRNLAEKDTDATLRLASVLAKTMPNRMNDRNIEGRANAMAVQKILLACVAEHVDLAKSPWQQTAVGMAGWWIAEAEHTAQFLPITDRGAKPYVAPARVLDAVPEGAWAKALPGSLRERIDVSLLKTVLVSDHYEDAVELIVDLAKDNADAGISMAEQYVKAWARRHDPHIPEEIRKEHKLPDDARILVTPMMMEKNIASLTRMMDMFRRHRIRPRNAELLVGAFDVCYSNAEVYRQSHIEKVFGPIDRMDEEIFIHMIRAMTRGLTSRWRTMGAQQASGTERTQAETLEMVRAGYRTAIAMIDHHIEKHEQAWKPLMLAGSLLSDWGDFEYYQQLAGDDATDRMEAFREKNNRSERYFTRAAETYAAQVPELSGGKYSIDVYVAWFHSLLGINTGGTLNLSKPLDRRVLGKIREMMRGLPGDAAKAHIDRLAKHVSARMEETQNPLHEELKYKYLAGSLVITKESPFSFQAGDKVAYYDELLEEVHLQTRVDGPNTIHRDREFGIILSVQHTEALGRMADFGEYLTNQRRPGWVPPPTQTFSTSEGQGQRDKLEMNILESLALFFDVESIVFSPSDVQPRATDRAGWEETILAYIHAKAKDSSVDKIPRIAMDLKFLDMTGPVTISVESPETMIKVTDKPTPPRPYERVELVQTLDARSLASTEEVTIEVTATVCGLVPELEELLDLQSLEKQLPIARIDPQEGLLVQQVNSWGDTVHAVSQRQWTISLDASALVQEARSIELHLPAAKNDATVKYQAYADMDLIDLEEPTMTIGEGPMIESDSPDATAIASEVLFALAAAVGGAVMLVAIVLIRLIRGPRERPLRPRDLFHMPSQLDSFVVVQLLKALGDSELVRLSDTHRTEMQTEIDRIQTTCFHDNGSGLSDKELQSVAKKWLKIAC